MYSIDNNRIKMKAMLPVTTDSSMREHEMSLKDEDLEELDVVKEGMRELKVEIKALLQ